MSSSLQALYVQAAFRLASLTWLQVLDLVLVSIAFYLLLRLVQRSRAALLLRGVLVVGIGLFVVTVLLPLPTFDWLVRGILVVILVTTPIVFQPELRRLLERVGRSVGLARTVHQTGAEYVVALLVRAVENLAANRTGALICLEGHESLQDVVNTGILLQGRVTSELLQTIFYPDTPLHDGAVILRDDRVLAAACVLPLTQRLDLPRRLGMRHRAAIGLSEISDALMIVVSEETGKVAIARGGQLRRPVDSTTLRERLLEFFVQPTPPSPPPARYLLGQLKRSLSNPRFLLTDIGLMIVSLSLAMVAWWSVTNQTNPARQTLIGNIPLRVVDVPQGDALITQPPPSVEAVIQTTSEVLPSLGPNSFQATVSLKGLPSGLHHVPIQVDTGVRQVRILQVIPPALDLELAPLLTRTLPVKIDLVGAQRLSPAYELAGSPTASPAQVQVSGPAPLVQQVAEVRASVSLEGVGTSLREMHPVQALDQTGHEVARVTLQPDQVQIGVVVQRRLTARDVGVRPLISGTPPPDYWVTSLEVTPATVTLEGAPDQLASIGSFVDTLPVNVSQAAGDLRVDVPLNLPTQIQALDANGNPIQTVTVLVGISPRQGDLVVARPVEISGVASGLAQTADPATVDVLLSGPSPILDRIKADPSLVRVLANAAGVGPDQSVSLKPDVVAPGGVQAQLIPPSVVVTVSSR
jgi:diadenylate cyclase